MKVITMTNTEHYKSLIQKSDQAATDIAELQKALIEVASLMQEMTHEMAEMLGETKTEIYHCQSYYKDGSIHDCTCGKCQ